MIFKIKNSELIEDLIGKSAEFPRYTSQIINLANQNSQGTRPKVVGQLSELINECPKRNYEDWKKWYLLKHPDAISNATYKIENMVSKLKKAIEQIDKKMIKNWVKDLVLEKTYIGLRFQESILKKVASHNKATYKLSNPKEESKGIDGFIGDVPVSIKPTTYRSKKSLREKINVKIIYYDKTKDGLMIDAGEII